MKATNEELLAAYAELGSVKLVGARFGMNGASVHERLVKLGASSPANLFGDADQQRLIRDYNDYVNRGALSELAAEMGRSRQFLCRKAKDLGLTDLARPKATAKAVQSAAAKLRIARHGHARGMAGKRHSAVAKAKISETSAARWAAMSEEERSAHTLDQMKAKMAAHGSLAGKRPHGSWKAGWREIGPQRIYARSRWEANYARYLEWLRERGLIAEWKHEPETFWFDKIKRGVRSYLPDFRVTENDGSSVLHEVKGWMDARSKTTLARMGRYHPQETIIVIREKQYKEIARKVSGIIAGWER